jgi:hypothetical protein
LTSSTTERFRRAFYALPEHIQQRARLAYRQFRESPSHPSLHLKQVHASHPIYVGAGAGRSRLTRRRELFTIDVLFTYTSTWHRL